MTIQRTMEKYLLALLLLVGQGAASWAAEDPGPAANMPELARLRGTIESIGNGTMVLTERSGATLRLDLPAEFGVQQVLPYPFADIKVGDIVGSTGMPQAEHTFNAIEVRKFPGPGGPPAGQRESNLQSGSILTNGRVVSIDTTSHPKRLVLEVDGVGQTILVDEQTPVATYAPADMSMLKPGVNVYLHARPLGPDHYRLGSATMGSEAMPTPAQ